MHLHGQVGQDEAQHLTRSLQYRLGQLLIGLVHRARVARVDREPGQELRGLPERGEGSIKRLALLHELQLGCASCGVMGE